MCEELLKNVAWYCEKWKQKTYDQNTNYQILYSRYLMYSSRLGLTNFLEGGSQFSASNLVCRGHDREIVFSSTLGKISICGISLAGFNHLHFHTTHDKVSKPGSDDMIVM
jgi:hypothetical protein